MKLFLLLILLAGAGANLINGRCSFNSCANGATCREINETHHFCECIDSHHYGLRCEYKQCQNGESSCETSVACDGPNCPSADDICERDQPCLNDGFCTNTALGFECSCLTGFSGPRCEISDFCSSSCSNGYCIGSECICDAGWTGTNCDEDLDECLLSPCAEGSQCINRKGSFECICAEGRTGLRCEQATCSSDRECLHGGSCFHGLCICQRGFNGPNCELTETDPCKDSPCVQHNKLCMRNQSEIVGYSCVCPPGLRGRFCDEPIDTHYNRNGKCLIAHCPLIAGDGTCNAECNHFGCGYDGGDCSGGTVPFQRCFDPDYCSRRFHDGVCDPACNNEKCLFDGFDCAGPEPEIRKKGTMADVTLVIEVRPEFFVRKVDVFLKSLSDRLRTTVIVKKTADGEMEVFEWNSATGEGPRVRFGSRTDARVEYRNLRAKRSAQEEIFNGTLVVIQVDLNECKRGCFSDAFAVAKFIEAAEAQEHLDPEMPIKSAVIDASGGSGTPSFLPFLALAGVVAVAGAGTAVVVRVKRRTVVSAPIWQIPTAKQASREHLFGSMSGSLHVGKTEIIITITTTSTILFQNFGEPVAKTQPVFKAPPPMDSLPAANPLEMAANGNENITLELQSLARAPGRYERTALHWLALNTEKEGHRVMSDLDLILIKFEVDVNAQDQEGNTALHYACQNARPEMARRLLKSGADPSIDNEKDMTPLHVAALFADDFCIEVLLGEGLYKDAAKLNVVDMNDRTPLMLYAAKSTQSIRGAELLLKAGTDVNYAGDKAKMHFYDGLTALHHAAIHNKDNRAMIELLLSKNANKDAQDINDATPLWHAVNQDNLMAVDALIKAKASLDFADHQTGCTPHQLALRRGYRDIAERLRVAGLNSSRLGLPPSICFPKAPTAAPSRPKLKARRTAVQVESSHDSTPSPPKAPSFLDSPHSSSDTSTSSPPFSLQQPWTQQPQPAAAASARPSPPYDVHDPAGFNYSLLTSMTQQQQAFSYSAETYAQYPQYQQFANQQQ